MHKKKTFNLLILCKKYDIYGHINKKVILRHFFKNSLRKFKKKNFCKKKKKMS